MQTHNVAQLSEEWFTVKLGRLSASNMADAMATGRGNTPSKTRQTLLYKLAGERITGERIDTYQNAHMLRGIEREPEARALYKLETGNSVEEVGFIVADDDRYGCSPDGLIDATGMLEIKDKLPHLHIACLDKDEIPAEHLTQLDGQMLVAEREYVDFVSHCRGLPLFIKRHWYDKKRIDKLRAGVLTFCDELDALEARIRGML